MTDAPSVTACPPECRALWLRRLMAASALVLIAVTWRLWTPQSDFPQVPLLALAAQAPAWVDWTLLGLVLFSLAVALVAPSGKLARLALMLFTVSLSGMMLLDQHRIQPWAYQFALVAIALAWCDAAKALRLVAALTIGIYTYSAISKFDYAFVHTLGQQLVGALLGIVGAKFQTWPPEIQLAVTWWIPLGELLVAFALCFQISRRWALYASLVMHVLLIVALGPLGLHHKPGVLLWNGYFILQNILLFAWTAPSTETAPQGLVKFGNTLATLKYCAALLLPLGATWGFWDEWPSWGLYSARGDRAGLFVLRLNVDDVPSELRRYLHDADPDSPWIQLQLDRWSLDTLAAPLYPQARFQLGVAVAVIPPSRFDRFEIVIAEAAGRITGKREEVRIINAEELAAAREKYWLNSTARPAR